MRKHLLAAGLTFYVAVVVIGCAHRPRKCESVAQRYVEAAGAAVFPSCALHSQLGPPQFTSQFSFSPQQQCGRAMVEFVVGTDGFPIMKSATVIQSNDPQLADAIISFLHTMRYRPAMKDGIPVNTLARFGRNYSVTVRASTTPGAVARGQGGPRC